MRVWQSTVLTSELNDDRAIKFLLAPCVGRYIFTAAIRVLQISLLTGRSAVSAFF